MLLGMLAASAGKIRFNLFCVDSDLGGLSVLRSVVWTVYMLVIDFLNSFYFDRHHNSAAKSKGKNLRGPSNEMPEK